MSYEATLTRVEDYFDRTATRTWERLTSDAPVSRIRETVRAGRAEMRAHILDRLPGDLAGARVLDAGCGTGQMTADLAARGADVVAVDISPALVDIAARRLPGHLAPRVSFAAGDMLDPVRGGFDHVVAMDSLIYYREDDIAAALSGLAARSAGSVLFTVAPRTPLLMAMWRVGKLFPRSDRSPAMLPHAPRPLAAALRRAGCSHGLTSLRRVSRGFYISQAMELSP